VDTRPGRDRVPRDADIPAGGERPLLGGKRGELPADVDHGVVVPVGVPRVPEELASIDEPIEGRHDPDGPALLLPEALQARDR
jgi:hypothetical protein